MDIFIGNKSHFIILFLPNVSELQLVQYVGIYRKHIMIYCDAIDLCENTQFRGYSNNICILKDAGPRRFKNIFPILSNSNLSKSADFIL